jgi:hypothetical protein
LLAKIWDADEVVTRNASAKLTHAGDFYFNFSLPGDEPAEIYTYKVMATLHRKGEFFTAVVEYPNQGYGGPNEALATYGAIAVGALAPSTAEAPVDSTLM